MRGRRALIESQRKLIASQLGLIEAQAELIVALREGERLSERHADQVTDIALWAVHHLREAL